MKLKTILILFLSILLTFSVNAQNRREGSGSFDIEQIKKEKADYLKKELNLTDKEVKAFIPVEAEYMQKKYEINRDARRKTRDLRRKEKKTDKDFQTITNVNLEAEQKESQLQMEYFQKFSRILSAEKVENYRHADLKFKEAVLKRHREGRSSPKR